MENVTGKTKTWLRGRWKLYLAYVISSVLLYAEDIIFELPNPDAVNESVFLKYGYTWELQLGRFMIAIWHKIFGLTISAPLSAVLTLLVLSMAVLLLTEILPFRHFGLRYLAGMLFLCSPHVQSLLSYYYCSVIYSLALLLVCLALWLLFHRVSWFSVLSAIVLLCMSCGAYQAYMGIYLTAGLMMLIAELLRGEDRKAWLQRVLALILSTLGGVTLYLVANKLVLRLMHLQAATARGFSSMGSIDFSKMPSRILEYVGHYYIEYFFGDELINNSYGVVPRRTINLLFFGITVLVIMLYLIFLRISIRRKIFAVVLCCGIPFTTMALFLFAQEISITEATGTLMSPAYSLTYLFVLYLADGLPQLKSCRPLRILQAAEGLAAVLVALMLMQMALDGQTYMRTEKNRTLGALSLMESDIIDAERTYGAEDVYIAWGYNSVSLDRYYNLRESVHWLVQSYGLVWSSYEAQQDGLSQLSKDYLGFSYSPASAEEAEEVLATPEYAAMPSYPAAGYVQEIGDVIVLKFAD